MLFKRQQKPLLIISMLPLFLSACSFSASKVTPGQNAVAEVNGITITRTELDRAEKVLLANKPGLVIPPLLRKEFEVQTLNQLISSELLFQASRKLEIKDLDKQAQDKVAEIKKRFTDPKEFYAELKKIGLDEQGLLESTRRDLAIAYLVNTRIATDIKVEEEEIKNFYEKNADKFLQPEQVRASHILIGIGNSAGAEERKSARAKAEKVREELLKGGDFAKLAREGSTCPSAKQGGDLGYFSKGRMEPAFEKAAFALEPGKVSDIVETRFGYHIIKVVERKKAEKVTLSAARENIRSYLRAGKINAATEAFVGEARKNAQTKVML